MADQRRVNNLLMNLHKVLCDLSDAMSDGEILLRDNKDIDLGLAHPNNMKVMSERITNAELSAMKLIERQQPNIQAVPAQPSLARLAFADEREMRQLSVAWDVRVVPDAVPYARQSRAVRPW